MFEFLAEKTIPELVRVHPEDQPLRIWIAGCSTGEETYSLAILFHEGITAAKRNIKLQVFASDVDPDAVASAREGLYPETIEADVSPERLARFFSKEDHSYRVLPTLRATVVFTVQDVLADPPFSRLDFVSCRNLLIYLRPEAQAKVVSVFHFALREGGLLLLGSSETIGGRRPFRGDLEGGSTLSSRRSEPSGRIRIFGSPSEAREPLRSARDPAPSRERHSPIFATDGHGHLCAGGGSDQSQVRVPPLSGPTDRYLKVAPGTPDARSARHGARRHADKASLGNPASHSGRMRASSCPEVRSATNGDAQAFNIAVQPYFE